jgi:hypothetical protein
MRLERMAEALRADPTNVELLKGLDAAVGVARVQPLEVNLWKIQNICYEILPHAYHDLQPSAEEGRVRASAWTEHFRALAEKLTLRVAE